MQLFQQEMSYAREDIWMNLWGSFSDCSVADDCIFIQTFCFSLLIFCRLEMVMRVINCKVICTFAVFFIHTLPITFFEIRSRYNLSKNKSLHSLKYLPKGGILHQKTRREMRSSRVSQWLRQSISSDVVVSLFIYKTEPACSWGHFIFHSSRFAFWEWQTVLFARILPFSFLSSSRRTTKEQWGELIAQKLCAAPRGGTEMTFTLLLCFLEYRHMVEHPELPDFCWTG